MKGDYELAIKLYSKGIEVFATKVLYSNRAGAYTKLERYNLALLDAQKCIELEPLWIKVVFKLLLL